MLIFFVNLGDLEITGRAIPWKVPETDETARYEMTFRECLTENTQTLVFIGEVPMLNALCDWLVCNDNSQAYDRLVNLGLQSGPNGFLP